MPVAEMMVGAKVSDVNAPRTGVFSLPEDKPKIAFHAAMMAIENFGFFMMYWDSWGSTPAAEECDDTRYAVGMMALTCFGVAFLCVGMGLGGFTDDKIGFTLFWFLHLVGGSFYTACTVIVPLARFSDDGEACAKLHLVNGNRIKAVYIMHAALYLVYVGGMLAITYFAFLKHKIQERKLPHPAVMAAAGVVFGIPQAIVYATL